jgi:hypothetical protein
MCFDKLLGEIKTITSRVYIYLYQIPTITVLRLPQNVVRTNSPNKIHLLNDTESEAETAIDSTFPNVFVTSHLLHLKRWMIEVSQEKRQLPINRTLQYFRECAVISLKRAGKFDLHLYFFKRLSATLSSAFVL